MIARLLTAAAVAVAALALAACGGSDKSKTGGAGTSAAAPATTAHGQPIVKSPSSKVAFATPKDGATVGSKLTAKVRLEHFRIDPKAVGQAPQPGVGHLHFSLDEGKYDYAKYSGPNGKIGKQLGVNGKYSPALAPAITYSGLPAGKHTLEVYLANNNHTTTGVDATVHFTVR